MENIYHPFEPDDEKSKYSTKVTAILYLFATLIIGGGIALVIFFTSSNTFNKSASLDPNQLSPLPSTQTANEVPATNPDNSGGGSVAGVNYDTSFGPQLSNKATATPVPTFTPTPTPTSTPSPTVIVQLRLQHQQIRHHQHLLIRLSQLQLIHQRLRPQIHLHQHRQVHHQHLQLIHQLLVRLNTNPFHIITL